MEVLKSFFGNIVSLEKSTGLGRYNLQQTKIILFVWAVSILTGVSINGALNLEWLGNLPSITGFQLEIKSGTSIWMTVLAVLNLPICITGLFILQRKGLIKNSDIK